MSIPVMNKSCSIAIAQSFINQDLYLAWAGLDFGETPWTTDPPTINASQNHFDNEICRRRIQTKKYVKQDENGSIISGGYRWSESTEPTNCILLIVNHDLTDASDSIVYKFGVFGGTKIREGINKDYVLPGDLTDRGYLIMSANINQLQRSPTVAENREIILRF